MKTTTCYSLESALCIMQTIPRFFGFLCVFVLQSIYNHSCLHFLTAHIHFVSLVKISAFDNTYISSEQ